MNFTDEWTSLCRNAQAEAERYAEIHPVRANRFHNDAAAFRNHDAPDDEHDLVLRRIAFAGMLHTWHHLHLAELLGDPFTKKPR